MARYDDFTFLSVSVEDRIATVLLDGPDGNRYSPAGHEEFGRIWPYLDLDDDVDVVVVTGAGGTFSDGNTPEFQAKMMSGDQRFVMMVMEHVRRLVVNAIDFSKPSVCALNGTPALGGTLAFALLNDFVIAERHVRFTDRHVGHGVTAGDGGVLFWPLALGLVRAKRYLLLGDTLDAEEAERLGLVTEVVERGESLARAMDYARRLRNGHAPAIRYTKRALNEWLRLGLPAFFSAWGGEAITAGLTDRPPAPPPS